MPAEVVSGAAGWQLYQLTIPVPADAKNVTFGVLDTGDGTAWFDGLSIRIDGEPYSNDVTPDLDFETGNGYEMQFDNRVFHTAKQSLRVRHLPEVVP
jgi:hypothetical protein